MILPISTDRVLIAEPTIIEHDRFAFEAVLQQVRDTPDHDTVSKSQIIVIERTGPHHGPVQAAAFVNAGIEGPHPSSLHHQPISPDPRRIRVTPADGPPSLSGDLPHGRQRFRPLGAQASIRSTSTSNSWQGIVDRLGHKKCRRLDNRCLNICILTCQGTLPCFKDLFTIPKALLLTVPKHMGTARAKFSEPVSTAWTNNCAYTKANVSSHIAPHCKRSSPGLRYALQPRSLVSAIADFLLSLMPTRLAKLQVIRAVEKRFDGTLESDSLRSASECPRN